MPHGFQLVRSPVIGKYSKTFVIHWCEILNMCSFDLMALTIQELSYQLEKTKEEMTLKHKTFDGLSKQRKGDPVVKGMWAENSYNRK